MVRCRNGETRGKENQENFPVDQRITPGSEGQLQGRAATTALVLAAGPLFGLVYAALLPFIGIGIVTKLILTRLAGKPAIGFAHVAIFNWRPTEAYLAGRRHAKKSGKESPPAGDKTTGKDKE